MLHRTLVENGMVALLLVLAVGCTSRLTQLTANSDSVPALDPATVVARGSDAQVAVLERCRLTNLSTTLEGKWAAECLQLILNKVQGLAPTNPKGALEL